MRELKNNALSLIAFLLSGVLLFMVQFGYLSPIGWIVIPYSEFIWLFWISVILFIFSTANLVVRIPNHAKWSEGYSGKITRTVKLAGKSKDYFIQGVDDAPIREVLLENWPFSELDQDSSWHVIDIHGNDITDNLLSSLDGVATIIGEEDTE